MDLAMSANKLKRIVYSPRKVFRLHSAGLKLLLEKYGINSEQAYTLERHDERLIEAVEHETERLCGVSSLVVENIPLHQNYAIAGIGLYKELLVIGDPSESQLPESQLDHIIPHMPVSLSTADLSKSCLYDRTYGVFYVFTGAHEVVAEKLLQLHMKMSSSELQQHLKALDMTPTDFYLMNYKGCCFKSRVSSKLTIGDYDILTPIEMQYLAPLGFDKAF